MSDEDRFIRIEAIKALGELHSSKIVNLLANRLKGEETLVQEQILETLSVIADPRAAGAIIELLASTPPHLESNSDDPLGDYFSCNSEWRVRAIAAKVLGKLDEKRAVKPLVKAIQSPSADVILAATEALENITDPRTVKLLLHEVNNLNLYVVLSVCVALGNIGDKRAADKLTQVLFGNVPNLSHAAAEALRKCGVIAPLIAALEDPRAHIREIAKYFLQEKTPNA